MPTDLGNWIIQRFVHPPHIIYGRIQFSLFIIIIIQQQG